MKRGKADMVVFSVSRHRSFQMLLFVVALYLILVTFELPFVFTSIATGGGGVSHGDSMIRSLLVEADHGRLDAPRRPQKPSFMAAGRKGVAFSFISGLRLAGGAAVDKVDSELERSAKDAWALGGKLLTELELEKTVERQMSPENRSEACPDSISLSGEEFYQKGKVMVLPCGLTLGSHITLVGKPYRAHEEYDPKISTLTEGSKSVWVSQFMMELQGLKTVEREEPPKILHFNPRLKGDWSGKPVIEQNTCYRMQWGSALRCEGWKSKADEETVDGLVKCEKWIRDDDNHSEESKAIWWLNRLIGRTKRVSIDWPYPFSEEKLFVLTLSAGLEGYHVNVDGRHVTSFPHRTGFVLEDATGLSLNGDIEVRSIFAASLPSSHPSFAPQRHLEMSTSWRAPPLSGGPVVLFIGILSAGNHFAERMAVRKSWMQHKQIKSSHVVGRFFVALHGRKEVNAELKKEAEFFGDIIVVPFMDSYDLVVLKTIAICEYGVRAVSARYIMKCDDDTFVRVDSVLNEANKVPSGQSFYIGNINYYHKPLRYGKWAVTYEEWPEEDYPPYANGPGYIVSADIARFVVSEFEKNSLWLFKMEDVSMGMWVEKFNSTNPVQYVHDLKFYQFGCLDDYFTAHYQSPRQMMCMWNKLRLGKPQCCNTR